MGQIITIIIIVLIIYLLLSNIRIVPQKLLGMYMLNPMTPIINSFRKAFLGIGVFQPRYYLCGWGVTLVILFIGVILFNKVLLVATVQSHIGQFHKPLMKLLKENGWEIHVAARNNLVEKNGLQLEYPDAVFDIPFRRSPLDPGNIEAYRKLKKLLASTQYDVIHCNTPVGGVLTRIAASRYRRQGTKVYYTAHGFHFYHGAPLFNWLVYYPMEKWLAGATDKLITINKEDYDLAKRKFSCPVYRIHGVGANSEKFRIIDEDERKELRPGEGKSGSNCAEGGAGGACPFPRIYDTVAEFS